MNEEKMYTDIDVIQDAVNSLGRTTVRVDQVDTLGFELNRIMNNLRAVLEAKGVVGVEIAPQDPGNCQGVPDNADVEIVNEGVANDEGVD